MRVPEPDEEQPLAWSAILEDTPVYSADGQDIGTVQDVLGAEDIFHGIVVRAGPLSDVVMIPADAVALITNRRIETMLSPDEIRALPPYQEEESFRLGVVGLLRKHMGWVSDEGREHQ